MFNPNAKEEAIEDVKIAIAQIASLYRYAERLAKEHDFTFDYSGPAGYGDSGWFDPNEGWQASSQSC